MLYHAVTDIAPAVARDVTLIVPCVDQEVELTAEALGRAWSKQFLIKELLRTLRTLW